MGFRIVAGLSFAAWAGCSGGDPSEEDTDPTTDDETEPTDETGTAEDDLTGKEGSVVLVHNAESYAHDEYDEGFAVFRDDTLGIVNLAHCWPGFATCVSSYPSSGTAMEGEDGMFMPYDDADSYEVDPLLVGSTPNELSPLDDFFYFDWYWDGITGWGGDGIVGFDGDYAPYTGTADFRYPTPMVVTSPDPRAAIEVSPDDIVTLTWEPAADGMVLLEWRNTVTVLEDDGSHDVAVVDIEPFPDDPIHLLLVRLSRVVDTEVDAAGNMIRVQTRSQQLLSIRVGQVDEEYTELVLPDDGAESCDDAALLAPLLPGLYWGDLSTAENDEVSGNLTGWLAPGNDAVARIDLLAGQSLTIEYVNFRDASMYLLTDSCDPDDGLGGSDVGFNETLEELEYDADTDGPVYLVLDSYLSGGSFFWVDLRIDGP